MLDLDGPAVVGKSNIMGNRWKTGTFLDPDHHDSGVVSRGSTDFRPTGGSNFNSSLVCSCLFDFIRCFNLSGDVGSFLFNAIVVFYFQKKNVDRGILGRSDGNGTAGRKLFTCLHHAHDTLLARLGEIHCRIGSRSTSVVCPEYDIDRICVGKYRLC